MIDTPLRQHVHFSRGKLCLVESRLDQQSGLEESFQISVNVGQSCPNPPLALQRITNITS